MTQLHFKSATQLAAMIRAKKIGCLELLEHFLARVDAYNPALNAIVWQDRAGARRRARKADAAVAKGEKLGRLHGVPMTIKESFDIKGAPSTWGLPAWKDNIATADSVVVQRLTAAGANIFGKTNVPLMLASWQSFNEVYGTTNNPWDAARGPGGSSGGSAASLAAGFSGADCGSDIGASIRNPAHYCGVYGHKPTFGVVPDRGHRVPGWHAPLDIAVCGAMARSAADLGLMLDIIAGPDHLDADAWSLNLPKSRAKSLNELRVAVMLTTPTAQVDTAYGHVLQDFVDQVARAGGKVSDKERPEVDMTELHDLYFMLLRAALSAGVAQPDIDRWTAIRAAQPDANPRFLRSATEGVTMEHRTWLKYDNRRHEMRAAFAAFFDKWDVLLCPVAASTAFPHNQTGERWGQTIAVNNNSQYVTEQMFWAGLSGMVFLPSTVGPAGRTSAGLPGGYQAIAGHGRDHTAIAFARLAEREIGGFVPPPGY